LYQVSPSQQLCIQQFCNNQKNIYFGIHLNTIILYVIYLKKYYSPQNRRLNNGVQNFSK